MHSTSPSILQPTVPALRPGARQPARWISQAQFHAFTAAGTTAHRLASGSHGWAERLENDVLISYKNELARQVIVSDLELWAKTAAWQPQRIFSRFLPTNNDERVAPTFISGDETLPLTSTVRENEIPYGIDFAAGYSHGLFLDQRTNRKLVGALKPKRLLNTFAYTCSFGVVAALAGAETVNLDLSKKSLDRGKENYALNGLAEKGHRFLHDDVMDALPKLQKKGDKFDVIILDPPTFSRGNDGRRWQVEEHFEDLINTAFELTTPKCSILLSTNCTKIDHIWLESTARYCAKLHRRNVNMARSAPQEDFPAPHGATTLWMHLR